MGLNSGIAPLGLPLYAAMSANPMHDLRDVGNCLELTYCISIFSGLSDISLSISTWPEYAVHRVG